MASMFFLVYDKRLTFWNKKSYIDLLERFPPKCNTDNFHRGHNKGGGRQRIAQCFTNTSMLILLLGLFMQQESSSNNILCNITWFSYPKLNSIFTFSRFLLTVFRAVQIFLRKKIFSKHLRSNFRVNTRPKFNVHTTFIRRSSSHMNALDLFNLTRFVHWDESWSWPDPCNKRFQTCQYIT